MSFIEGLCIATVALCIRWIVSFRLCLTHPTKWREGWYG
jgi:hypothetical protein